MRKLALITALTMGTMGASFAQDADAINATTDFRQGLFKVIGWDMGTLAGMAKGELPFDATKAQAAATRMDSMANSLSEAFIAGTYKGSKAKEEIDAKADVFKKHLSDMLVETKAMVAASGAEDTLKPQMGKLGGTCKACHDDFRSE